MLTSIQTREYNRFSTTKNFLIEHLGSYKDFLPFKTETDAFILGFGALTNLIQGKMVDSTGVTTTKKELKERVANDMGQVNNKARAYALKAANNELAAQVSDTASTIIRFRDADLLGYVQSIRALLMPLVDDTEFKAYNITQAKLDMIVNTATDFNALIGEAREDDSDNAMVNSQINAQINIMRGYIDQMDLLVSEFDESDPAFVEGYKYNTKVVDSGVRHSGIEGMIMKFDGEPIANAEIWLEGTGKKAVSDLRGKYRIVEVRPDDYTVIAKTNEREKSQVFKIERGKVLKLDIVI